MVIRVIIIILLNTIYLFPAKADYYCNWSENLDRLMAQDKSVGAIDFYKNPDNINKRYNQPCHGWDPHPKPLGFKFDKTTLKEILKKYPATKKVYSIVDDHNFTYLDVEKIPNTAKQVNVITHKNTGKLLSVIMVFPPYEAMDLHKKMERKYGFSRLEQDYNNIHAPVKYSWRVESDGQKYLIYLTQFSDGARVMYNTSDFDRDLKNAMSERNKNLL